MAKINRKSTIVAVLAFTMLAMAGAADAKGKGGGGAPGPSDIPDWTELPGANPVTPTNILSTGGTFEYKKDKKGKVKMTYKTSKDSAISLEDVKLDGTPLLGNSLTIEKGKVDVKKGDIKITGIDPLGTSNKKVTLVTAKYDESGFAFDFGGLDLGTEGIFDLFGVSTYDIDCPQWDFCTTAESFYVAGNFGSNPDKIKDKNATAVTTIPVPAAVWLFGSGLIGLVGVARRGKSNS